jgi:hypothetical protein
MGMSSQRMLMAEHLYLHTNQVRTFPPAAWLDSDFAYRGLYPTPSDGHRSF